MDMRQSNQSPQRRATKFIPSPCPQTSFHPPCRGPCDGSLDASFDAGTTQTNLVETGSVKALAVDAEGRILVGGYFGRWLGKGLPLGLLRLNPNGSMDESFPAIPTCPLDFADCWLGVGRLRILSDGSLLGSTFLGGSFSENASALFRSNGQLAKLLGDPHDETVCCGGSINDRLQDARGGLLFAGNGFLVRHQFAPVFRYPTLTPALNFAATLGAVAGRLHRIEASADMVNWQTVTNVTSATENLPFTDPEAATAPVRFYRPVAQ